MSIEQKIDFVQELDESIREKSIQYLSDSKLCRLNSGHPSTLPESWAQIAEKVKNWRLFVMTSETPKIKARSLNLVKCTKKNQH